jgi:hypothetical protein
MVLLSPAEGFGGIPPEEAVQQVRLARIAGMVGDTDSQREILEKLVKEHPGEPNLLLPLLEFFRTHSMPPSETEKVRGTLREALLAPGSDPPVELLRRFAADSRTTENDLILVRDVLQAGASEENADVAVLRLLVAIQGDLGQKEEQRRTLGRILEANPDPFVRSLCIGIDIDLGRWEDALALLRSQDRTRAEGCRQSGSTPRSAGSKS